MRQLVGIRSPVEVLEDPVIEDMFKRESLFFHKIAIPHLQCLLSETGCAEDSPRLPAEIVSHLEWLLEKGVIMVGPDLTPHSHESDQVDERAQLVAKAEEFERFLEPVIDRRDAVLDKLNKAMKSWEKEIRELVAEAKLAKNKSPVTSQSFARKLYSGDPVAEGLSELRRLFIEGEALLLKARLMYGQLLARITTIDLREQGLDAYSVFYSGAIPLMVKTEKHDVIQIVLDALPTPDDSTSWEQILDYRSDPDSQGKFLALKQWINDVVRAKLSAGEIQDKLDFLIHDYEQHINRHKLKINRGAVQTLIVGSAELVENLMRLKFSALAKSPFFVKNRRIELLEAEASAPGREIAYIV